MTGVPFCAVLSVCPSTRIEHKVWVDMYMDMSLWCAKHIVDHWGADDVSFCFSFEKDLAKFKNHFGIE